MLELCYHNSKFLGIHPNEVLNSSELRSNYFSNFLGIHSNFLGQYFSNFLGSYL